MLLYPFKSMGQKQLIHHGMPHKLAIPIPAEESGPGAAILARCPPACKQSNKQQQNAQRALACTQHVHEELSSVCDAPSKQLKLARLRAAAKDQLRAHQLSHHAAHLHSCTSTHTHSPFPLPWWCKVHLAAQACPLQQGPTLLHDFQPFPSTPSTT